VGATGVLIRKELRQHWMAFTFLAFLLGLAAASVLSMHYFRGVSSSVFLATGILLQFALPGAALVICGRLVLAEYRAKTQLFLEALPFSRWRMVTVKYFLGLGALLLFVLVLLAAAGTVFSSHEAMTPRFAAILAARAGASAFIWYSFFFTTGLLGRYRSPILIMIVFVGYFVDEQTSWDARHFGPFELLNQRFGSERREFPLGVLESTLGVATAIAAVGFVLALVKEGNVSALLAERMSHREKVFVAVILLGSVSAIAIFEDRKHKPPYDLSGAVAVHAPGVLVKVAGPEEAARPLAEALVAEFGGLREYLGIDALPMILVTYREDLDGSKYERGELTKADGFVVRANYTSPDFERERFAAWLIPELLDYRSHQRTQRESGRWVRDGVGEFWIRRARISEPMAADPDLALRALHGAPNGMRAEDLRDWYKVRERVGGGVATGLAWSGLKTMVLAKGEDECRRFLCAMYAPNVPQDVRASFRDWRNPWPEKLRRAAGFDVDDFVAAWSSALLTERDVLGAQLAEVPRLTLAVQQHAATDVTTLLKWRLAVSPAPKDEIEYRIRYLRLPGLDEPFEERDLIDESARAKLDEPIEKEVAESFARGTRAVIGAAVYCPELGCDVISGWQRLDIGP
jgi:hypothetical protein